MRSSDYRLRELQQRTECGNPTEIAAVYFFKCRILLLWTFFGRIKFSKRKKRDESESCFSFADFPWSSHPSSCYFFLHRNGLRLFRYKVVSIQVDSIKIEVVLRHHPIRFDTYKKSIGFNSIFRPVAGGETEGAWAPSEIFRFELNSATKVEFCLLKWTAVNGSYSFQVLSIIVRWCTFVLLFNMELCKFFSPKNYQLL